MLPAPSSLLRTLRLRRAVAAGLRLLLVPLAAVAAGASAAGFAAAAGPRPNDPAILLPLERYGFQPLPAAYMIGGGTMLTLDFVDNTHVLFTFHTRGLMPRLPDSAPEDDDRRVTAVLIELPSGNEIARTIWRTRDHEQYLWPLGRGHFLLRIRNRLTVLDPMHGLEDGHPFEERPFLELKRRIGYISVSPGGDLLAVETAPLRTPKPAPAATSSGDGRDDPPAEPERPRPTVEVHFYRISNESQPAEAKTAENKTADTRPDRLIARSAGILLAPGLVNIPATAEGFIDITKESPQSYLFDFQSHAGKRLELAGYDTSCAPRTYFISRSEFVAFGCHGAPDKIQLSEFNLRGENSWISVFPNQHIAPQIVAAPQAGRFALSRLLVSGSFIDLDNLLPQELSAQEIVVMQNHDGRQLLKVQVTPIQRAGQNFDLSPDGMSLATLQTGQLAIYHLAPLTAKDQKEIKLAQDSIPEKNDAMIRLQARSAKVETDTGKITVSAPANAPTAAPAVAASPAPSAPQATPAENSAQSPADEAPRKPPTLYDKDHPKPPSQ